MKSARVVRWAVVVLVPALVMAGTATRPATTRPSASPERIHYGRPAKLCELANQRIDESSGLACSRLRPGVFWTHNDSGDRPRIYAFDAAGRDLGCFTVRGARAVDWEDMASFRLRRKAYLLLADVGDNASARRSCQLYIVPEPPLNKAGRAGHGAVDVVVKIDFTYQDGPHNCESVAVDPLAKKIYLATKEFPGQAKVYELPLPARSPGKSLEAKAIASIDIPMATAPGTTRPGLNDAMGHAQDILVGLQSGAAGSDHQCRGGHFDNPGKGLGGAGVEGLDDINAQFHDQPRGIAHPLHRISLIGGNELATGVRVNDHRKAHVFRLGHQGSEVRQEQRLIGTANRQCHGDSVGSQAQRLLHPSHPDIPFGMIGREGGAFQNQRHAPGIGGKAPLCDPLHKHHGIRPSLSDSGDDRADTLDASQHVIAGSMIDRHRKDAARGRVLHSG